MDFEDKILKDDLLAIIPANKTKLNKPMLIIKDSSTFSDNYFAVYHYSEDFEKELTFALPTKNRKTNQILTLSAATKIINKIPFGVLSFQYDDIPYGVSVNHVYKNGKLYFHCATSGFKLHAINKRVSYLIVEDLGINEAMATHNHNSVMIQGTLLLEEDEAIKKEVLLLLMQHLAPSNHKNITRAMVTNTNILVLDIDYIHGKSHIR